MDHQNVLFDPVNKQCAETLAVRILESRPGLLRPSQIEIKEIEGYVRSESPN